MSKRRHASKEMKSSTSEEKREFTNHFTDYVEGAEETAALLQSSGKIHTKLEDNITKSIEALLQRMEEGLGYDADDRDYSVYTGTTGIALLYFHLYNIQGKQEYLVKAHENLKGALRSLRGRRTTFLCGDAGPYALGAVVYKILGKPDVSKECLQKLQLLQNQALRDEVPNEMLYGKIGYLYALLFVRKHLGDDCIEDGVVEKLCNCIIDSGKALSKKESSRSPLLYTWHGKHYIGAAHGMSGIYYILMQVKSSCVTDHLQTLIRPSIDYICEKRFPSGNFLSSLGNQTDRLIHWCHGSPGAIFMLIQAYQTFSDEKYLEAAKKCGDVIWERGLLRKGYGLCHGTGGNAYAFLSLYQCTNDEKHLYRACKFTEWCLDYGKHGCRTPDKPFSLFEGLAGTIYFLADMLTPGKARFPAMEL